MSLAHRGKKPSAEAAARGAATRRGMKRSDATKAKLRARIISDETRRKISAAKTGIPRDVETRKKLRQAALRFYEAKRAGLQSNSTEDGT